MNKNKIKNLLEFVSATLVLSYFFIQNILFVIIGILLSIYLININKIEQLFSYINKVHQNKNLLKNKKNNDALIDYKTIDADIINHNSNLTLVEIIEESGFIPSIDKTKDIDAAL
tara:strand:- start:249 stop:593 length:345 start_codon:yes stop_codon:yes gene_type:complete